MTEPTDAEIMLEASKVGGLFDDLAIGYQSEDILKFARAVLARRGQPSGTGEVVAVPLTDEQRSDIATAAAGFNWTDDYVEAIDYVIDGVEMLHSIKGDQQ